MEKQLKDFLNKNGYPFPEDAHRKEEGGYLPCYVTRVIVRSSINTVDKCEKLIELSALNCKRGILVFSVTENDSNHKVFIKTARQYVGATVTKCLSRWHGDYKCWMISIPIE